jgi:outer membrane protein OmpA-like peptidoglycan-associated protein
MRFRARVGRAFRRALATPVRGNGRDLIGLLAAISQDRGQGTTLTWLATFGLPTVAPADTRILLAADPAQAAESIRHWLPDLRGVRVHLILNPPAGRQPALNTATDNWRRSFVTALLREAGASIASVTEVQVDEQPAPGAPPAPPVPNLPETTPRPRKPPALARPYQVKLDSAAFFLPNSTAFATSRQQVLASLAPVIAAWKTGGYARAVVVGHCARFGPPGGALALSRQRASIIAALLRAAGVTHITAIGVGYSRPLPPSPYSATNRVVIVTIYPKA